MTDKMREEFEAWQIKNMLENGVSEVMARASLAKKDGKYGPFVEFAWTIWQASRATLVVELPETSLTGSIGVAHRAVTKRCREAIEAAGVRVKQTAPLGQICPNSLLEVCRP